MGEYMLWNTLSQEEQDKRLQAQSKMEKESFQYGIQKYWKEYDRSPDEGLPEQQLLDQVVMELSPHYQEWIDKLCSNPRSPEWLMPLLALGADKMADLTVRTLMREWLISNIWNESREAGFLNPAFPLPTAQRIANCIAKETISIIAYNQTREDFREDWRRQSKFVKNWTPQRCKAFADRLGKIKDDTYSLSQRQDFGHHMVRIAQASGVVESYIQRYKGGKKWKKRLFIGFSSHILERLHEKHKELETKFLVYRPMVCPPVPHELGKSGGYLNKDIRKEMVQRFVSDYDHGVLQDQKYSQPGTLVIKGLNAMMNTEWCINHKVLDVMTKLFENDTRLANLPPFSFETFMFNDEFPVDGSQEEKAKWCSLREECWGNWFKSEQSRNRMLVRLALANKLAKYDFWYMPYTLDFRGRAYSICELLSCQGSDFDRGLIQFANPMKQNKEGLYWLKVHTANLFDQDKLSFDDRVKWVDDNWDMLERISKDPFENKEWVSDKVKKNPSFQRLAAVFDLMRDDGMTQIPVNMDGKCNGSQHWSAIMGDELIALLTNVLPSEEPQDLYQYVANKTTEYCKRNIAENDWFGEFLAYWHEGITRGVLKRPTMCDSYGLTFYGIQKYVKVEGHLDWIPKEQLGGAVVELARAIKAGLEETLTKPNVGKEYLKEIANISSQLNQHLVFTAPSGFKMVHAYFKPIRRRSLAALFNHKELSFSTFSSKDVDKKAVEQAIPPNFIHALDASHMFCTVAKLITFGYEDFSMVHDSYGCHAPLVPIMRNVIKDEFYKMHKENQLENFKQENESNLAVCLPDIPQRGELRTERVLESNYFFA